MRESAQELAYHVWMDDILEYEASSLHLREALPPSSVFFIREFQSIEPEHLL